VNAKQLLISELQKRNLDAMAKKAIAGEYSDLGSPYATPVIELIRELEAAGHRDLADRARNGDFDHER
jgi:hypothetical protein